MWARQTEILPHPSTTYMLAREKERRNLKANLHRAVFENAFAVHYQPIVSLASGASGAVEGVEALLRWPGCPRPGAPIGEIVSILEETGLIGEVGQWVLREACCQVRDWQARGAHPMRLNVNLSACQFDEFDLAERIGQVLQETGFPAGCLELEITESQILHQSARVLDALEAIKALGVSLYMDDFGTGFCSLAYLQQFPLDGLKIDRRFVADLPAGERGSAITLAIMDLARRLGLKTIAEGVETRQQAVFLEKHGCLAAQGFYYGAPVHAEILSRTLLLN